MMGEGSRQKLRKILSRKSGRRDASIPQQLTPAGSFVHLPDATKQVHVSEQHAQQIRRGSLRGVEEPELVDIDHLEVDDIVIAVMGPTGSGKSTFVCAASGRDTKAVGHRLRSFTDQVSAVKFWDQESRQHIVLVDTPGFDDTFKSDLDILSLISKWLVSSYNKKKLLSGILYLHRITDNRVAGSSLKNLRVFRKLCGKDALDKVYLTTTMWDEVESNVGERRLEELKAAYWKAMISQGAQVARCRSDDDSPKQLVRKIIFSEYVALPPTSPRARQPENDATHGGTSVPQHQPEQVPSSDPRKAPQGDDVAHGGVATSRQPVDRQGSSPETQNVEKSAHEGRESQTIQLSSVRAAEEPEAANTRGQELDDASPNANLLVEDKYKHGPSSDPRQIPQGDDVARAGIMTSPQPVDRQGSSPETQNVEKSAHKGREPQTIQPGSILAAEEPEATNTRGQELDDASPNADLLVEDKHGLSSDPRQIPQGDDVAREGIVTSPQLVDRRGSQANQPGSVQAAEEPEVALTRGREVDDALANVIGLGKKLLIQDEIAELKKELKETAAGQQLYSQLETLVEKQLELLKRIEKEKKAASKPEIVQDLQTEYNDLRAQIDDKLHQMQQLKLPWLRRFFLRRRE